jgi:hypothetical protein
MALLAEEFALLAMMPGKGRPGLGTRSSVNACLAGLLIADLALAGHATIDRRTDTVALSGGPPDDDLLSAVATVVAGKGPKVKSVMSGMDRGLRKTLHTGIWDAVNVARAGVDPGQHRDEVIARLRLAASTNAPIDVRTALVLSMTGPANLLELVAPNRGDERKRARHRIDHAADDTPFDCLPRIVRKLIAEANAAAVVGATVTVFGG